MAGRPKNTLNYIFIIQNNVKVKIYNRRHSCRKTLAGGLQRIQKKAFSHLQGGGLRASGIKDRKNPSDGDIRAVLESEADKILAEIPQRTYTIALCIEGKQLSSEELATLLDSKATEGFSDICFIIGSSHGLSDRVKKAANARLSMSKLTFPHQLARVMLFEAVYRATEINRGTKYHK